MSDLNLIPNPQVMLAQAVIFISQVYVINRFLVVPFTKLKNLRSNATVGADSKSDELKREIKILSDEIQGRLAKTHEDIKRINKTERAKASSVREASLVRVQKEVTDQVNSTRMSIQASLQEERKKIHALSEVFVHEVYERLSS